MSCIRTKDRYFNLEKRRGEDEEEGSEKLLSYSSSSPLFVAMAWS
jgi:hypothetical protein